MRIMLHLIDENIPRCLRYVQLVRAVTVGMSPQARGGPSPFIIVQLS